MRTLRELAGWSLLFVVQVTPFVVLGLFASFAADELSAWALLAALLLALAWPRTWLSARRLREPPEDEVAEADGRRPVLLLHAPARATVPLLARALFGQPGLFRDLRDAFRERAIERAVASVGPVLRLARPAPPPEHGPLRLEGDDEWRRALDRLLRRSALAVIVLDGSDANALEIERAAALLGLERTILVAPPELSPQAYARLRARLPMLPELDRRARAIRFAAEGRPVYLREILVHPSETAPAPKPPLATWLLVPLVIGAALFSAIGTPILLDDRGYDRELFVFGGLSALVIGVWLAGLSRRAVRLVPANEAVMVTVAALPWILLELAGWIRLRGEASSYRIRDVLEGGAVGAAYAAPLLAATAVVLAVGSLVRHAPGRRGAFAVFGAAALLPFGPLALSIDSTEIVLAMIAGALTLGLAAWSASGEPARANAPLPIGAAVAGALSVAALTAVASHAEWAWLLEQEGRDPELLREGIEALSTLAAAWPWFAMAGPAVAVLVATQFSGRATRVGLSSMLAFVPFVLACTLASVPEARARGRVDALGGDALAAADGVPLAPGFELPRVSSWQSPSVGAADVVLDASGVIAGGERLATLDELALAGTYGSPPAVTRALARIAAERGHAPPRIAVRRDMDVSHVQRMVRAARRAGLDGVDVVVRSPQAPLGSVRIDAAAGAPGPLYVVIEPSRVVLADTYGSLRYVPHVLGAVDEGALRVRVTERRQAAPNEQVATVVVRTYPGTEELLRVAALLRESFPRVVLGDHAPL